MPLEQALLSRISDNDLNLKVLDFTGENLNLEEMRKLAQALKNNQIVITLSIWQNQIDTEGVITLVESLYNNHSLVNLDLAYNNTGPEGAISVAELLKKNNTLTSINLSQNNIGALGAAAIAKALKVNHSLTALKLWNNNLTSEGVIAIAEGLKNNNSVTLLDLSSNNMTAKGIIELATLLTNTNILRTLDLSWNDFIDDMDSRYLVKALKVNHSLIELNIKNTKIDSSEEKKLNDLCQRNQQAMLARRRHFVSKIILLTTEIKSFEPTSSLWGKLPRDIKLYILNFLNYQGLESIGKTSQQLYACAVFLLDNSSECHYLIKNKHRIKVIETLDKTYRYHFQFFKPNEQLLKKPEAIDHGRRSTFSG